MKKRKFFIQLCPRHMVTPTTWPHHGHVESKTHLSCVQIGSRYKDRKLPSEGGLAQTFMCYIGLLLISCAESLRILFKEFTPAEIMYGGGGGFHRNSFWSTRHLHRYTMAMNLLQPLGCCWVISNNTIHTHLPKILDIALSAKKQHVHHSTQP